MLAMQGKQHQKPKTSHFKVMSIRKPGENLGKHVSTTAAKNWDN